MEKKYTRLSHCLSIFRRHYPEHPRPADVERLLRHALAQCPSPKESRVVVLRLNRLVLVAVKEADWMAYEELAASVLGANIRRWLLRDLGLIVAGYCFTSLAEHQANVVRGLIAPRS